MTHLHDTVPNAIFKDLNSLQNHMTNIMPAWERNTTFDIYRSNSVQLCKYYTETRVIPFAKLFDMEVLMYITTIFCEITCHFMFKIQIKQRFYVVLIYISKGGKFVLFEQFEL